MRGPPTSYGLGGEGEEEAEERRDGGGRRERAARLESSDGTSFIEIQHRG